MSASLSAQDAVVVILPCGRKAGVPSFSETMEFSAIVPAARLLAEIAAKGALVAELGTGGRRCALRKRGIAFLDNRTFRNLGQRYQRAYAQPLVSLLYAF